MEEITLTPEEQIKVEDALARIAMGGVHKKDIRREIRELEDRAYKLEQSLMFYGPHGARYESPILRDKRGKLPKSYREKRGVEIVAQIKELERKAELYRYVLANGEFPKGYRR